MRYTRQELKHDKFADTAADALHWTAAHRQKLITAGIAVAIVILLAVGAFWYMNHRNQGATVELGKALATYNAPIRPEGAPADPNMLSFASPKERATAAKAEFDKVGGNYESTQSGQMAKYFSALCDEDLGNTQGAEQGLKALTSVRNADVAALSKFALASLYRDANRETDAVNVYKDLIAHPSRTVPKTTAQMELAAVYATKQPAEAKKIYQEIAKEDPKGPAAEMAAQREAALKQ